MKMRIPMVVVTALFAATALAPSTQATTAHVRAFDFGFGPFESSAALLPDLVVRVEYRNIGLQRHQATSFADGLAPQGLCINSPAVDPGRTVTVVIAAPSCLGHDRAIDYFCAIHPFMQGRIVVRLL